LETYITIFGDYKTFVGRRGFVEQYLPISSGELIHALSYFLDSENEHRFIIEVYVDQIAKAAAASYIKSEVPEAIINMLTEDLIGIIIQQEILQEGLINAVPHLKTDFLNSIVDEALAILFDRVYSAKTRRNTAKKYLSVDAK